MSSYKEDAKTCTDTHGRTDEGKGRLYLSFGTEQNMEAHNLYMN